MDLHESQDANGKFKIYKWSLEYQIYTGFGILPKNIRKKSDKRLLSIYDRFKRVLQEGQHMMTLPEVFSVNITDALRSIFIRYAYSLCSAGIRCENSVITESLYYMAEYISASTGDISKYLKEHSDNARIWNINAPSGVNIYGSDLETLNKIIRHVANRTALRRFVGGRRIVLSIYRLVLLYITVSVANCVLRHIDKMEHANDLYVSPLTAVYNITYMGFMYMSKSETDDEDRTVSTVITHVEFKHILMLLTEEIDRQ